MCGSHSWPPLYFIWVSAVLEGFQISKKEKKEKERGERERGKKGRRKKGKENERKRENERLKLRKAKRK